MLTSSIALSTNNHTDLIKTLTPLASIALLSANEILGLPAVLERHGWVDGNGFSNAIVDIDALQRDLWALYNDKKDSRLLRCLQYLPTKIVHHHHHHHYHHDTVKKDWNPHHPIQSFREYIEYLAGEDKTVGRTINELTHITQVCISNCCTLRLECENFKRILQKHGWNIDHYAFFDVPNFDNLLKDLV